jgi:hypothetical protein
MLGSHSYSYYYSTVMSIEIFDQSEQRSQASPPEPDLTSLVVLLSALNLPETGYGLWLFIQSTASSGAGRLAGDACAHQARAAEARRLSQPEARTCRGGEHPQAHRCIVADAFF